MGNPSEGKNNEPDKKCGICKDILVGDDEKTEGVCEQCHKENPPCLSDPAIVNAKQKSDEAYNNKKQDEKLEKMREESKQTELPIDSKHDLKAIAKGIHKGEIFTSQHIHPNESVDTLSMVFMPLALMDKEARQALIDSKPAVFFAYNKDSAPRSINGYPIFFSVEWVTEAEWLKVVQYLKKLEQFEKELEV